MEAESPLARAQITKFAIRKGKIEVNYEVPGKNGRDLITVTTDDAPQPSLAAALQNLAPDIAAICEVDIQDWHEDNPIEVRSVSFKWDGDVYGVVMSAKRELRGSRTALVLNTPLKWTEHEDHQQTLEAEAVERLDNLTMEVKRFLEGHRAQGDLFTSSDGAHADHELSVASEDEEERNEPERAP